QKTATGVSRFTETSIRRPCYTLFCFDTANVPLYGAFMHRASRPVMAVLVVLVLAALAEPRALGPARPVQLAKGAAEAVIAALQKDRADDEKWLRSDATSYLATIARRDFGDKKTLTIGRAADNDVR